MTRRFQLYLPDPVLSRLELEARNTGRSKADIIREALERYFALGAAPARALSGLVGILGKPGGPQGRSEG
jgi:hypothetical protein